MILWLLSCLKIILHWEKNAVEFIALLLKAYFFESIICVDIGKLREFESKSEFWNFLFRCAITNNVSLCNLNIKVQ